MYVSCFNKSDSLLSFAHNSFHNSMFFKQPYVLLSITLHSQMNDYAWLAF